MRNIHVKLNEILTSGSGGEVVYRHFFSSYLELLQPIFSGLEPFEKFW